MEYNLRLVVLHKGSVKSNVKSVLHDGEPVFEVNGEIFSQY